jgi:hypothetical protein
MPGKDREASADKQKSVKGNLAQSRSKAPSRSQADLDILHVRRVVAGNPNTPMTVLARLAEDSNPVIRRHVAENPRTPPDILTGLATDHDLDVRLAVAENSNAPPDTLSLLASDNNVDVRFGVAENPHMPEDILVGLTNDENPYVRYRAIKTLQILMPGANVGLQYGSQLLTSHQFPHENCGK